jgi:hypothetical protein
MGVKQRGGRPGTYRGRKRWVAAIIAPAGLSVFGVASALANDARTARTKPRRARTDGRRRGAHHARRRTGRRGRPALSDVWDTLPGAKQFAVHIAMRHDAPG